MLFGQSSYLIDPQLLLSGHQTPLLETGMQKMPMEPLFLAVTQYLHIGCVCTALLSLALYVTHLTFSMAVCTGVPLGICVRLSMCVHAADLCWWGCG